MHADRQNPSRIFQITGIQKDVYLAEKKTIICLEMVKISLSVLAESESRLGIVEVFKFPREV
jgi:hypothetical protein